MVIKDVRDSKFYWLPCPEKEYSVTVLSLIWYKSMYVNW